MGADETNEILGRVTDDMVRKSYFIGDAKSVASELAAYHEAGVSWLHLSDLLPIAVDLEDGAGPMDRSYEVFRILRGA